MKVIILEVGKEQEILETSLNSVREILSYWKFRYGNSFTERFSNGKYKYILVKDDDYTNSVVLREELLLSSFPTYDTLVIVNEVYGEMGADTLGIAIMGSKIAWAAATTMQTVGIYALTAAINIGLAIGTQLLINSLSKTPEFSGDPVKGTAQMSNLFGGARITVQQGGCVPLLYGLAFAGGTLISSSVTTSQG